MRGESVNLKKSKANEEKMKVINILGHEFTTMRSLKEFAAENGIKPEGNKTLKATWIDAIEDYLTLQAEVIAVAKETATETAIEADAHATIAAAKTEEVVISVGTAVVELLTSDAAIELYRFTLKGTLLVLIFLALGLAKLSRLIWAAACSRASDWIESDQGAATIGWLFATEASAQLVLDSWDEVLQRGMAERVDRLMEPALIGLARLGLHTGE